MLGAPMQWVPCAGPQQQPAAGQSSATVHELPSDKQVLYKGKWIMPVRLLVRAKVFQLMGGAGIAVAAAGLAAVSPTVLVSRTIVCQVAVLHDCRVFIIFLPAISRGTCPAVTCSGWVHWRLAAWLGH